MHCIITRQCTSELLRVISRSDFIILGSHANSTTLSKYMWQSKETPNLSLTLARFIAKKVPPYSNISKMCLPCLHKKLKISNYPRPDELLNKRSELISKCLHANKFLCNYKTKH